MEISLLAQLLANPVGIALVIFAFIVISLPWSVILASDFKAVGWGPLIASYAGAAAGSGLLAVLSVSFSSTEQAGLWANGIFNGLLDLGKLCVTIMIMSAPVLGVLILVSSWLLRGRKFTRRSIFAIVFLVWVATSLLSSLLPSNEWSRLHRLDSMLISQVEVLSFILFIVLPFLSILRSVVGRRIDA